MSDLLKEITPQTIGLCWFTKNQKDTSGNIYVEVDYLLNGLLTASINSNSNLSERVIVGNNFGKSFFVLISESPTPETLKSFFSIFNAHMTSESSLAVIDEVEGLSKIQNQVKEILPRLRLIS